MNAMCQQASCLVDKDHKVETISFAMFFKKKRMVSKYQCQNEAHFYNIYIYHTHMVHIYIWYT